MEDSQIQTKDEQEEKDILAKIQGEALRAPEPGGAKVGMDVSGDIGSGEEKVNIPAVISSITSAGHSYLYNTKTGDRSRFNNNMLPRAVKQRWPDGPIKGQLVWSVRPVANPPEPVKTGTHLCMLHKDAPNREAFDEMGFAVCPKDCLVSIYQVRRHMMKKHKDEWAALEDARKEKEKAEDRKLARAQLEVLTAKEKAPLYVSDKDKKKK